MSKLAIVGTRKHNTMGNTMKTQNKIKQQFKKIVDKFYNNHDFITSNEMYDLLLETANEFKEGA